MNRRWGFVVMTVAVTVGLTLGLSQAASPGGKGFLPVAPAAEVARVNAEYVEALVKLTKEAPTSRRNWRKVAHRAWLIGETANLLTLQKDGDGALAKHAGVMKKAAEALTKAAKLRKFDGVPAQVKAIQAASQAAVKIAKGGKTKATEAADYTFFAPLIEIMELNQTHFDELSEIADESSADDKAFGEIAHRGWILAETGNLLTQPNAGDDAAEKAWQEWAAEMRQLGTQLAKAAGAKDFAAAKGLIKKIDNNCVACHEEYQ